jgi:calcium-dependent protein kinase
MEYCDGGSLGDLLGKRLYLTETETRKIVRGVLEGVEYLHDHSICHRDIKPDNILFDSAGVPKLTDFGLSNIYLQGSQFTSLVGSPYFIAPEVITGGYDMQCDIWSLGVLVALMLTGKQLFDGLTREEVFERIKAGQMTWMPTDWEEISSEGQSFV